MSTVTLHGAGFTAPAARAAGRRGVRRQTQHAQTQHAQTQQGQVQHAQTHQGQAKPRLRLTRRGRVVFTSLAALPLVIVAFVFAFNGGRATASGTEGITFDYVTIESGQTLWQLAEEVAPMADPRDVIADIRAVNHLASSEIQPGQQIAIPPRYTD